LEDVVRLGACEVPKLAKRKLDRFVTFGFLERVGSFPVRWCFVEDVRVRRIIRGQDPYTTAKF